MRLCAQVDLLMIHTPCTWKRQNPQIGVTTAQRALRRASGRGSHWEAGDGLAGDWGEHGGACTSGFAVAWEAWTAEALLCGITSTARLYFSRYYSLLPTLL